MPLDHITGSDKPLNTLDAIMDTLEQKTTSPKPEAKRPEGKKVSRARPAKGEVDQNELTDEIIARFPKILAALAK